MDSNQVFVKGEEENQRKGIKRRGKEKKQEISVCGSE